MTHLSESFEPRPLDVWFDGMFPDEKVYFVFDKHWIAQLPEILMFIVFYLFTLVGALMLSFFIKPLYLPLLWLAVSFYLIITGSLILIRWLNESLDLFILTDKRLIDITQHGFLNRKTTTANLSQIQHVSYIQKGIVDNVFDLGLIDVLTAGSSPDLRLEYIQYPAKATDMILEFVVTGGKIEEKYRKPHANERNVVY